MAGEEQSVGDFARSIIDQMNISPAHSQASVVEFSWHGTTLIPMSDNRAAIESAIGSYGPAGGATNITGGLLHAWAQLSSVSAAAYTRIAILLSDGEQNVYADGPAIAFEAAHHCVNAFCREAGGGFHSTIDFYLA